MTGEVRKFKGDDQIGEPFETVTTCHWYEPDGTVIEDTERIAVLTARLAQRQGDDDGTKR